MKTSESVCYFSTTVAKCIAREKKNIQLKSSSSRHLQLDRQELSKNLTL